MITQEQLKELLHYNPETGVWIRLSGRHKDKKAGYLNKDNYLCIWVCGKQHYAHRLAWLYMTGEWPDNNIDHKDLNESNCKWENLREADKSKNGQNRNKPSNNTSGVKGVWWNKRISKWMAEIKVDYKKITLGQFDNLEEAALVRANASLKYHGEFARVE